ncbi:dTMP kinase [Nitratiruptor sp. YY08-26]|uniref:dTMP kinase n=1 Tax=unclassified Nitratiruptor TaxID=2624044 RepID=UPI0019156B6E|nr:MULTISPECIES: dTMP kinase [unclassified Nitratiruptor]BCD62174.1 dTMP kinase [Nitratiruptor sp. YY08-13]BCD66110.1 dTMP kinase [Nitratiruptor sp. YY08-26]
MYILFEGIDRVGKSTQIALLQKAFPHAIFTKEPGGTPLGKKIRELILHTQNPSTIAELFLFLADRAEHIQKIIIPNKDKLIISDRGFISGIAYAKTKTSMSIEKLQKLNAIALQNTYPDKIVFLEISPQELERRLSTQPLDNIEQRGIEYLLEVQEIMKNLVIHSKIAYLILDATASKEKIFEKIVQFIKEN